MNLRESTSFPLMTVSNNVSAQQLLIFLITRVLRIWVLFSNQQALHKKWSFPLRISSVNVTKSADNFVYGHIYWRNP